MVRNFRLPLLELLRSGNVDLCFANEDEATELTRLHMYSNSLICLDAPLPENKGNGTLGLLMFCLKSHFSACRGEENAGPDTAVEYLSNLCKWAVVTLGSNGCIAKHGKEVSYCNGLILTATQCSSSRWDEMKAWQVFFFFYISESLTGFRYC